MRAAPTASRAHATVTGIEPALRHALIVRVLQFVAPLPAAVRSLSHYDGGP